MATVYKAYDTRLEAEVAVKVIRTENLAPSVLERSLKRFEREAKALARLTHPNIVKVTDYGDYEGRPYLVMEYLPGGTLKQRLGNPMAWRDAIRILLPITKALDFAHRQNMIHRDVKPSNILITADDEPMLTDFGIAKILDLEETQDLTGTSAAVGTPEYMAPEQATAKTVDQRADIYALGIVLYEMVTGRKPYTADTPMAILIKHATAALPRPSKYASDLPDEVEKILIKALAKNPNDRYQAMSEMAVAWQDALEAGGKISPHVDPPVKRKKKFGVTMVEETLETVDEEAFETVNQPAYEERKAKNSRTVNTLMSGDNQIIVSLAQDVKMAFMRIPAGNFLMGSIGNLGDTDEHPQHEVYLDEFWMGKTPVTNLQYWAFVNTTGHQPPKLWSGKLYPSGKEHHPVVFISWQDAHDFCDWVSKITGGIIRLPTEAEWEKAARGIDGRIFPWGNSKPHLVLKNFLSLRESNKVPVGYFSPEGDSPFGCTDMGGNVWEWISDWYDDNYYSYSISKNPPGPKRGKYRVVRSGTWHITRAGVRTTDRSWYAPAEAQDYLGFRCVLTQLD